MKIKSNLIEKKTLQDFFKKNHTKSFLKFDTKSFSIFFFFFFFLENEKEKL